MAIYGGFRVHGSVTSSESVVKGFKILNGEADDMFQGDMIKLEAAGSVNKSPGDADLAVVGVLVGVEYTNSESERVYTNKYNVDISRDDTIAYVNVDPMQEYIVRVGTGGTEGTITQAAIGMSLDIDATNAGNGTTGMSGQMAKTGTEATSARVRVIGVSNDDGTDPLKEAAATTYTHAIVIIDPVTSVFSGVGI